MKKTSFVVLTIVLTFALMGAGYAAWSDQLRINNTVNTGTLQFAFISGSVKSDSYSTGSAKVLNDKTLAVVIDNVYPGAVTTVTANIDNMSTIPALLTLTAGFDPLFSVTDITVNGVPYTGSINIDAAADVTVVYTLTAGEVAENTPYTGTITVDLDQNTSVNEFLSPDSKEKDNKNKDNKNKEDKNKDNQNKEDKSKDE